MTALSRGWDIPMLLVLSLIWASAFSMIKIAVVEIGPVGVVFLRCSIGGVLMLAITMMAGKARWPGSPREWAMLSIIGLTSTALPFYLISFAEQEISSGLAAILMTTGPLVVIILGHFIPDDEKINRGRIIGVGVGFIATIYLLRGGLKDFGGAGLIHPLAVVGAATCYSIGGVMARRLTDVSVEVIATVVLAVSAIFTLPFYVLGDSASLMTLERDVILAIIWLGLMPSGVAFYLRYFLTKRCGYGFVSYVGYLIPLFAIGMGIVLLDETVTIATLIAMAGILTGLFITRGHGDFPWALSRKLRAFRQKIN
jgi:drug/metabolite transporter (DMT)-like permease